jgi:hypothetical protein
MDETVRGSSTSDRGLDALIGLKKLLSRSFPAFSLMHPVKTSDTCVSATFYHL